MPSSATLKTWSLRREFANLQSKLCSQIDASEKQECLRSVELASKQFVCVRIHNSLKNHIVRNLDHKFDLLISLTDFAALSFGNVSFVSHPIGSNFKELVYNILKMCSFLSNESFLCFSSIRFVIRVSCPIPTPSINLLQKPKAIFSQSIVIQLSKNIDLYNYCATKFHRCGFEVYLKGK